MKRKVVVQVLEWLQSGILRKLASRQHAHGIGVSKTAGESNRKAQQGAETDPFYHSDTPRRGTDFSPSNTRGTDFSPLRIRGTDFSP